MLLLSLLACAPWGTWMFTKEVTMTTGDECVSDVLHNFVGAYEPIAAGDDPSWIEEDLGEYSPEVVFGRVDASEDGAVLIIGSEALPGTEQDDGSWLFYWTNSDDTSESRDHTSGYIYDHTSESSATLRVQGTFDGGTFVGSWESETAALDMWSESDSWGDEAAVYVGSTGAIPSADYLLRIDAGTGEETTASNTQAAYDCGEAGCTLTVNTTCAYRYTLTGVATDFEGEDSRWVEDAGQPAGN